MSAPHGQKQIPTRVLASLRTARNDKVVGEQRPPFCKERKMVGQRLIQTVLAWP